MTRKQLWEISPDNNAGEGWWPLGRDRGDGLHRPYDEYDECLKRFEREDARKDVS